MKKKDIDALDIAIVNELQRDASINNKDLSERIGLTPGPTLVRVQKLIERQIITHYTIQPDYKLFGLDHKMVCMITITNANSDNFKRLIQETRLIGTCYLLNRDLKFVESERFMVIAYGKSKAALTEYMCSLIIQTKGIVEYEEINVQEVIKECPPLIIPEDLL